MVLGDWRSNKMYEGIHKYLKECGKIILISIGVSATSSLILYKNIGMSTSFMLFIALLCLIIDLYLIYKDRRKSIIIFLLLLPIYTTVRRICYFDIFFIKVTFETIYITVLFASSFRDVIKTVKNLSFNFMFMILAFFLFCVNSSFYSVDILGALSEVYIGVLTPIMFMLCFMTYFNKDDKNKIYYILISALDFSCLYGFVQLLSKGISLTSIRDNRISLTFGFNNVNIFAGILIAVFPLLIEMILYKKNSRKEKLVLYSSFLLYSISLLITFSRGAWICYIAIIFMSLYSKKYRKVFVALLVPALFIAKPVFHYIISRGTTTSFLNNESAVARLQSIFTDIILMKKYPFGIGGGNFAEAYKNFSLEGYFAMPKYIRYRAIAPSYTLENAHNLILQIGVEFGIAAACIFVLIIINRLKTAAKNLNYSRGAFNSIFIYFVFSLITGNEFDHKGIIMGTIIMFAMFSIIELYLKKDMENKRKII